MKITIDTDQVKLLTDDTGKIIFTPDAENAIVQLNELKKSLDEAEKEMKQNIESEALKYDKNFKSVQGDRVKVTYRSYGAKYRLDESRVDEVPPQLIEKKVVYKLASSGDIDKYLEENEGLPVGIEVPDRPKQISITIKDD